MLVQGATQAEIFGPGFGCAARIELVGGLFQPDFRVAQPAGGCERLAGDERRAQGIERRGPGGDRIVCKRHGVGSGAAAEREAG